MVHPLLLVMNVELLFALVNVELLLAFVGPAKHVLPGELCGASAWLLDASPLLLCVAHIQDSFVLLCVPPMMQRPLPYNHHFLLS